MSDLSLDVRHGWRRLRRAPAFTATTLVVLALGLGATTTMFSIVDGIVLRPLPYPQADRLVDVSHSIVVPGVTQVHQSDAAFLLYQRHNRVFDGIAATRNANTNLGTTAGAPVEARRVSASLTSANLFDVLRVRPALGRAFRDGEDRSTAQRVAILSDALWRRQFGADRNVVGRRVLLDGVEAEIVGVMPADFHYPSPSTELWLPIRFDPAQADPGSFNYQSVARLAPGITREAATADLARILPRLLDEFPSDIPKAMFEQAHLAPQLVSLRDAIIGDAPRLLWILFGAVVAVWLIACANVANLVLVRSEGRQREMAVRTALGAGRGAVIRQYLAESGLIAIAGGGAGLGLSAIAIRLLASLPQGIDVPRLEDVTLDGRVVAFAAVLTALTAALVSVVPLLRARRIQIAAVLKESGRSATTGGDRQRTRSALVVVQVALALVLVATSGLLARSFNRLRAVQPGWDATHRLSLRYALPRAQYGGAQATEAFHERLLSSVRSLPGVVAVGLTSWIPLTDDQNNSVVEVEDHPLPPNAVPPVHDIVNASRDYFAAAGIPLLTGRTFGAPSTRRPPLEAVVSRAFAARYWKDGSPLGRHVRQGISGPWYTVVGVVGDVHLESLDKPATDALYLPLIVADGDSAYVERAPALVVHSSVDPTTLAASIRRIVHDMDPTLPLYGVQPMSGIVRAASGRSRFLTLLLAAASGMALLLGAVGIYGVISYGVSLRRREIGVRMALGARPSDVSRMVSRQGVVLSAVGVVIGLGGAIGVTRFLRGLLYDVSPTDPLTLATTSAALVVVALAASWLPARRAAAIDPAIALRSE